VVLVWTEYVANGGMAVPEGRACARSDAANDTRTKFPTSGSVNLVWRTQKLRVPARPGHVPWARAVSRP